MPTSHDKRKQLGLPQQDPAGQEQDKERARDLEHVEEGQELSADAAERLQPQMGNQAVQALLARTSTSTQTSTGTANVEVDEIQELDLEEEIEGGSLEVPSIQFGGGGGDDGTGDQNPWDVGRLFGGDDGDGGGPRRPRGSIARPRIQPQFDAVDEEPGPEDDDALPPDAFDRVEEGLGTTPAMGEEHRSGDARCRAIEPALTIPHTLGRRRLQAETLIDRTDHLDPIGRPTAIGRFLAQSASDLETRAIARILGGPASILVPTETGHAGACARLASLTVSTEASTGHVVRTDRGVSLALCKDAWQDAVLAARTLANKGKVVAPAIVVEVLGEEPEQTEPEEGPRFHYLAQQAAPMHLGHQALCAFIPDAIIPSIPSLSFPGPPAGPATDASIAAADAALMEFTAGPNPTDTPIERELSWDVLQPILDSATALVNAMGRTQVECAAAAIAVRRIRPSTPSMHVLLHLDHALRDLARSVVHQGDALHRATGTPMAISGTLAQDTIVAMRESAAALQGLRQWVFSTLAAAVLK